MNKIQFDEPHSAEEWFEDFLQHVESDLQTERERVLAKRAFFAGFGTMLYQVVHLGLRGDNELLANHIRYLNAEILVHAEIIASDEHFLPEAE